VTQTVIYTSQPEDVGFLSYNQSDVAQCKSFLHKCRVCGLRFHDWDKAPTCPDCGADRHCKQQAVSGYNFCPNHGAPNPRNNYWGIGRPMTNGGASQFPLTRLAAKYNKMMKDGRILSNRHSIVIIRDRVIQLMERLDENDAPDRLAVLEKLWGQYKEQKDAGQNVEMILTAKKIDLAFEAARTDFAVWNQMIQLLDLDRKMVESEIKIAREIKAIITADEATEMLAKIMASIFSAVNSMTTVSIHDKGIILKRVQYEFSRITGDYADQETYEGTEPGGGEIIELRSSELDRD